VGFSRLLRKVLFDFEAKKGFGFVKVFEVDGLIVKSKI
jgi:hypothetical protein